MIVFATERLDKRLTVASKVLNHELLHVFFLDEIRVVIIGITFAAVKVVRTDQFLQLGQNFASLSFQRLVKDNLTLARGFDEVACQLSRLLGLEAKCFKLSSEIVDCNLGFGVEIVSVEEKRSHLISDKFLLLEEKFEKGHSLSEMLWLDGL